MPARDLVGVAPNCLAARAAAPSLGLLLATARNEGVVLHTEQCYRPLSDQVTVKQRWSAAGHSSCAAPVLTTSSGKPKGTSMHGWGKAADLSDGVLDAAVGCTDGKRVSQPLDAHTLNRLLAKVRLRLRVGQQ